MTERVREFVLHTLIEEMSLEIDRDAIGDDTKLGPEGLDLESLAFVELMSQLTLGEFCRSISERAAPSVVKAE
jgi:acyl carrier protein